MNAFLSLLVVPPSCPVLFWPMRISKGLKQAYDLQDFTYAAALALRDQLRGTGKLVLTREDASAIGSLVKAWESCQERIRIHRNKPLPGVRRQEMPKPRKKLTTPCVRLVCSAPSPGSEPEEPKANPGE
jgi:hypothetical protein